MTKTRFNASTLQRFNIVLLACLLSSCAGSSHPRVITPSEGVIAPRYVELYSEVQVATLHFPPGTYELNAEDRIGYYYRAPRRIAERLGGGSVGRDGGIFVSKRNSQKLRGYVYRAGAITMIGNLSHKRHEFRD
jgi:hypothetical protein